MRLGLALAVLLALTEASLAGAIRSGATMQVKADSIWFQDAAHLSRWQKLKAAGDAAALQSYEKGVLANRDAWQFINPLEVRIRSYRPKARRVDVEMTSEGRLQGSMWVLDADALMR